MAREALIRELTSAVERSPDVVELRLHLAELLADDGRYAEALTHCTTIITADAGNAAALALLQRCTAGLAAPVGAAPPEAPAEAFDWRAAEDQVTDIVEPEFVGVEHGADGTDENDHDVLQRSDVTLPTSPEWPR